MSHGKKRKAMSKRARQRFTAMLADYSRTKKTYATMGALHTLAQHWVENESLIERAATEEVEKSGPKWTPDLNDDQSLAEFFGARDVARHMHDTIMFPMHRYSCIVMLYTTVERELLRLVENLDKEKRKPKLKLSDLYAKSKVEQISVFCNAFYRLNLTGCSRYESINDLQKIRDCIIHCVGDASLLKNEKDKIYLVKLTKKRSGFSGPPHNEMSIDAECIEQFLREIWDFFISVFKSLKWKISAHWQGDKLEQTFKKLKK
jgi:hypothetical protein